MKKFIFFIFLTFLGIFFCPENMSMSWIAAAVGAGLGVLSSLYGGAQAAKAARRANRYLDEKEQREDAWYRRGYNEKYTDTAAGQAITTEARRIQDETWKKAEGTNRVTGGTDAKVALAKDQGNKMTGKLLQQLAANDVERRDRVDRLHRTAQDNITTARMGVENQRAANITAAAAQASNSLMTAGALADRSLNPSTTTTTTGTTGTTTTTPSSPDTGVAKAPVTGSVAQSTAAAPKNVGGAPQAYQEAQKIAKNTTAFWDDLLDDTVYHRRKNKM